MSSATAPVGFVLTMMAAFSGSVLFTAGVASYSKRPATTGPGIALAADESCEERVFPYVQGDCAARRPVTVAAPASTASVPAPVMVAAAAAVASPVAAAPARIEVESSGAEPARMRPPEREPILVAAAPIPQTVDVTPEPAKPVRAEVASADPLHVEPARSSGHREIARPDAVRTATRAEPARIARRAKTYEPIALPRTVEQVAALDAPAGELPEGPPRQVRIIPLDGSPAPARIAAIVSPPPNPPAEAVPGTIEPARSATVAAPGSRPDAAREGLGARERRRIEAVDERSEEWLERVARRRADRAAWQERMQARRAEQRFAEAPAPIRPAPLPAPPATQPGRTAAGPDPGQAGRFAEAEPRERRGRYSRRSYRRYGRRNDGDWAYPSFRASRAEERRRYRLSGDPSLRFGQAAAPRRPAAGILGWLGVTE